MFRKRGRPPDPLPIGGYEKPNDDQSSQIPVHQLLEAPRQLPLPSVRELESDVVMQHERDEGTRLSVQPALSQHVDDMLNLQDRRLAYNPLQVVSPNQAIPNEGTEGVTVNVPKLPFSQAQRNEIFSETSSRLYRELCGPEGVVLQQQNNVLQQVIQEFHTDPMIQGTLSEQQENIGQIVTEIYRLREELAKLKLALKQGFILIDETCAQHASALEGLQSFAGAQLGTNQKVQDALQRLLGQMSSVHQRTIELEKNTTLDWRMQAIEDDLNTVQSKLQGGTVSSSHERMIAQLEQQVQELRQNPLWHEMQKTAADVQQTKERSQPVMKDIESRLAKLEKPAETPAAEEQIQVLKDRFRPVMQDIENG